MEKIYRITIIGDSTVGKSSFLQRIANGSYNENIPTTIGVDFATTTLSINKEQLKIHIWDTGGQNRFRSIAHSFCSKTNCIIVMFDLNNLDTFDGCYKWIDEILLVNPGINIVLIGNKLDLASNVKSKKIRELTEKYDIPYYGVSAKDNININFTINDIVHNYVLDHSTDLIRPKKKKRFCGCFG